MLLYYMYYVKISFGKPKYTARCQIRGAKINFEITPWTKPGGKHFFKISQFWDFLQHFSYTWQKMKFLGQKYKKCENSKPFHNKSHRVP